MTPGPGQADPYDFEALAGLDRTTLPAPRPVIARDGTALAVRHYGHDARTAVVALHGMFTDGSCFHRMATDLVRRGRATVHVPDLRGHGASGGRPGDVDHVGQLDEDLVDVLASVRAQRPGASVVLLGHSSGGALVLRHAGAGPGAGVEGYVLLAPFLGGDAPTTRRVPGGPVTVDLPRFADIARRSAGGDPSGQDQVVLRFDPSGLPGTGLAAQAYTYRMMLSLAPRTDFATELAAIAQPLLVVAGSLDGCFDAERYEPTIAPHAKGTFRVLPGVTHLGVLSSPPAWAAIADWIP